MESLIAVFGREKIIVSLLVRVCSIIAQHTERLPGQ